MTTLTAARVVTPTGVIEGGQIEITDGLIAAVGAAPGPCPDVILAPGFIDLQVNGHGELAVAQAEGADWERLDELLLAQGVTAWCPTLTSRPLEDYAAPLARIADAAGRGGVCPAIAGAHLEGPFLSPDGAGAHPPEHIAPVERAWLDDLPEIARVVTLAPELEGALSAIASLARRGVLVALGHTAADTATALAAIDAGARLVTHLFNTMPPLHHREPGVTGIALADRRLTVSLIADGLHVDPQILAMTFRAKGPGRCALVTDAVATPGPGLAGPIELRDGAPRRPDGTLAGSILTMNRAIATVVAAGVELSDAVAAASTVPARLLGLTDRGAIAPGRRADLVELDADLAVKRVWVNGAQAA